MRWFSKMSKLFSRGKQKGQYGKLSIKNGVKILFET